VLLRWTQQWYDLCAEGFHALHHRGEARYHGVDADLLVAAQPLGEQLRRPDKARAERIHHAVARSGIAFGLFGQPLGLFLRFAAEYLRIDRIACAHISRQDRSSPRRPGRRTQRIEARLLFIAQRIVEFHERGAHGLDRAKRSVEPLLHRLHSARRGQRLIGRALRIEPFCRLDG
jgi:hypothetical protein